MNKQERDVDREVEDLERAAEKVQDDIEHTKSDWEAKKSDQSVPGAVDDDDLGREMISEEEDAGG